MKLKIFSLLFAFALLASTASAATNEEVNVFIDNYNLSTQNNTIELACQIGQDAANAGMNADIYTVHFSNHKDVYIVTLYPEADNKKGYTTRYFWLAPQKKEVLDFTHGVMTYQDFCEEYTGCRINGVTGYEMTKSYFDNSSFEEPEEIEIHSNTSDVVENVTQDLCDTINTTYEIVNETPAELNTLKLSVTNQSTNNSIDVIGNFEKGLNERQKESIFEGIENLIRGIFNW